MPEQTRGRARSFFSKFPWSFLMIVYLLVTYFQGIPLEGVVGYVFVGLSVFVLLVEFSKSKRDFFFVRFRFWHNCNRDRGFREHNRGEL